ncbi:hypothetical protein ACFYWP_36915 [Actinacidiphila glaucinigra]|uniref:hypothetical protein n=1 Tax=Actinacidiphila glaucinigra TaxID=235986 RepID=UPI0036A055FD
MSATAKWEAETGWDTAGPEAGAAAARLEKAERTTTQQRRATRSAQVEKAVTEAVEAARPGLDKIPDPVDPAGEGELTAEEEERLALCVQGIALHSITWFMRGKALDTVATGRLFRRTPHKLEPDRFYASIEEWADVEMDISVSKLNQLRAAWPIGEVLMARGFATNPGQVRELVPVKNAYGLNGAVALYVLVSESAGAEKITAKRLEEARKLLPGNLELDWDEDPDVLATAIQGLMLGEAPGSAPPAIPAAVRRAVDRRAIALADVLDRGRIPRTEVQRTLMEAFADEEDSTVFEVVLQRMKASAGRPS